MFKFGNLNSGNTHKLLLNGNLEERWSWYEAPEELKSDNYARNQIVSEFRIEEPFSQLQNLNGSKTDALSVMDGEEKVQRFWSRAIWKPSWRDKYMSAVAFIRLQNDYGFTPTQVWYFLKALYLF